MALVYKDTKQTSKSGDSVIIYIRKQWEFTKGERVNFRVRSFSEGAKEWFASTPKLTRYGTGVAVFLDKSWGFKAGEMVEIEVSRREDSDSPGVGTEEEVQGLH